MRPLPHLSRILAVLGDGCLTTDAIARELGEPETDVALACKRAARDGRLTLASYGWNNKLAWCANETWAELRPTLSRDEPWHMTARDRAMELSGF